MPEEWNEWDDWLSQLWLHANECEECHVIADSISVHKCEEMENMLKNLPGPVEWVPPTLED